MLYFAISIHHLLYNVNIFLGGMNMHYSRLRDLREDSDLTQDQLVRLLGMHKTTYTNYEQGKREVPFSLVIRLAEFYNVTIDYIAGLITHPIPLYSNKPCRWKNNN